MTTIMVAALIVPLLIEGYFAFRSGRARGFHHARRDYPTNDTTSLRALGEGWIDRYNGGSGKYNQSWPWTADHAHEMMHWQVLNLAAAGCAMSIFQVIAYSFFGMYSILFFLLHIWFVWFVEGRGFTLYYHVLLPIVKGERDYTVCSWLIDWFQPW